MSKNQTAAQLKAAFKDSLSKYREMISHNWSCRHGDEDSTREIKEKLVKIFKKTKSAKLRNELLLQVFLKMGRPSRRSGTERWDSRISELAFELHDELVAAVAK